MRLKALEVKSPVGVMPGAEDGCPRSQRRAGGLCHGAAMARRSARKKRAAGARRMTMRADRRNVDLVNERVRSAPWYRRSENDEMATFLAERWVHDRRILRRQHRSEVTARGFAGGRAPAAAWLHPVVSSDRVSLSLVTSRGRFG